MSKLKENLNKSKAALTTRAAKVGSYSIVMTVVLLAILIALNLLVSALPATATQFDISAARLYSFTSSTKVVCENLDKKVTIYWMVQANQEDSVIERMLNVYSALSDNIEVVKKNPDVYPTFAAQYTDKTVNNNSLIVVCGDKSRYIDYNDIYENDTSSYYTTGSITSYFDGEGEVTTAIDYVVSDNLPVLYILSGHGELELGDSITKAISKANYETKEFSLLNVDEIPTEADAVLINAPETDISEEEAKMLTEYLEAGGHLFVLSGLQEEGTLENLYSVLANYGITASDGVVVEGDRDHYAFQAPYICLPTVESSDITDALIDNDSKVLVGVAEGLTISSYNNDATVTSLLNTSDAAFSKAAGFALSTYEMEEEDTAGPFSLAVSVEVNDGKMVWVSSDMLMDDTYISYSSGANTDLVMNALSWMIGKTDSISIRSKSLNYNYLTISASDATRIKICLIGIIPAVYLIYGIDEVLRRRKKA